jgi:hypothetical protein
MYKILLDTVTILLSLIIDTIKDLNEIIPTQITGEREEEETN